MKRRMPLEAGSNRWDSSRNQQTNQGIAELSTDARTDSRLESFARSSVARYSLTLHDGLIVGGVEGRYQGLNFLVDELPAFVSCGHRSGGMGEEDEEAEDCKDDCR